MINGRATVIGQTRLTILATVDVRPTTLVDSSHRASASVYSMMRVRQRGARAHVIQYS